MEPRSPFVIGVLDLMRRPGATQTRELTIPAPADLSNEVIGVPEGAPVTLDVRLESVVEGILATARVRADLVGECVRCLTAVTDAVDLDLTELFAYPGALELDPSDTEAEDIAEVREESIDLEQAVRDAVVLDLPFQPLCMADCAGLCAVCGIDLNTADVDHAHEVVDARWAALVAAFGEQGEAAVKPNEPTQD